MDTTKYARVLGLAAALGLGVGGLSLTGCDEGPMEDAGEQIDDAVDDTGDALEDAGDNIQDAAEDARQ